MIVDTRWATMQHRRPRRVGAEGGAQPGVGRQVEGRERVVEEVDVGPADQRPGDAQALALAARDVGPALGDAGLQAAHGGTKSAAWATSSASHSSSSVASGLP